MLGSLVKGGAKLGLRALPWVGNFLLAKEVLDLLVGPSRRTERMTAMMGEAQLGANQNLGLLLQEREQEELMRMLGHVRESKEATGAIGRGIATSDALDLERVMRERGELLRERSIGVAPGFDEISAALRIG